MTTPGDQGLRLAVVSAGANGGIVVWQNRGESLVFAQRINSTPPIPACGDPTDSGAVAASDALAILNVAIGIPLELTCPTAAG